MEFFSNRREILPICLLALKFQLYWGHTSILVIYSDKMCGRSLTSDQAGYCVINRMIDKNHS